VPTRLLATILFAIATQVIYYNPQMSWATTTCRKHCIQYGYRL